MKRITKTLKIALALVGMSLLAGSIDSSAQNQLNSSRNAQTTAGQAAVQSKTLAGDPFLYVTKTADTDDGVCDATDCSLREAITIANLNSFINEIYFSLAGDPNCINGVCTLTLTGGELVIAPTGTLAISGPGANGLIINAGGNSRIFYTSAPNLTIRNVTLTGGNGVGMNFSGSAGAVYVNGGTVTLAYVNVTANTSGAGASYGGVRFDGGTNHQIINSTFSSNYTDTNCGALSVEGTSITIANTTISGNTAAQLGGGVCIENSIVTLRSNTITGNTASSAGGILTDAVSIDFGNTIVAGNSATTNSDISNSGTITSSGNNLIGDNSGVETVFPVVNGNADIVGTNAAPVNAFLAALSNYGGSTPTHALMNNSPAINTGNGALAGTPTTDQRIVARVGATDIGAFERIVSLDQSSPLPNGQRLIDYNQTLTATRVVTLANILGERGFKAAGFPFVFEIVPVAGEQLPPGLTLSLGGIISGTPTTAGTFPFTVKATDNSDQNAGAERYTIQILAPTAAALTISGKVFSSDGRVLKNARVTVTNSDGITRTAVSNSFGNYRFTAIQAGQTYIFHVKAKGSTFTPQAITVSNDLSELNFTAQ